MARKVVEILIIMINLDVFYFGMCVNWHRLYRLFSFFLSISCAVMRSEKNVG